MQSLVAIANITDVVRLVGVARGVAVELEENLAALKRTWPISRYFNDRAFYDRPVLDVARDLRPDGRAAGYAETVGVGAYRLVREVGRLARQVAETGSLPEYVVDLPENRPPTGRTSRAVIRSR